MTVGQFAPLVSAIGAVVISLMAVRDMRAYRPSALDGVIGDGGRAYIRGCWMRIIASWGAAIGLYVVFNILNIDGVGSMELF